MSLIEPSVAVCKESAAVVSDSKIFNKDMGNVPQSSYDGEITKDVFAFGHDYCSF